MPPLQASQSRQSLGGSQLTFPVLSWKELVDLIRDGLGINIAPAETQSPTPALVNKLSTALLEIITQVPREEVGSEVVQVLENSSHPELLRDALPQLVLYREMEVLARASLVDFRMEDLVSPSGVRLQKLLSATLNFGRFHEEIMRQHAEQTESLTKLQDQLKSYTLRLGELAASIKEARERQAKEAPERAELENEIQREEANLRAFGAQRLAFEQGVDEDRKKTEQVRRQCDTMSFDVIALKNEAEEMRGQLVTSPERIQSELAEQKRRLEMEREESDRLEEEERALMGRRDDAVKACKSMEAVMGQLADVEEHAASASKAEEEAVTRKSMIDSHSYRVRELKQRELEAQRELGLAEERAKRVQATRTAKVESLKLQVKQAQRERELREREEEDGARRSSRLRAEAASLRLQLAKLREEHQASQAKRQGLFGDVVASFDAYTKAVHESAEMAAAKLGVAQ